MQANFQLFAVILVLAPLIGAIIAGIFGHAIGKRASHTVTILGVFIAFLAALAIAYPLLMTDQASFNQNLYTWGISGTFQFDIGVLLDRLTAIMILVVTFVSLLVHIYSIGYMQDDPGYSRFFSYMSLFTFSMLMLVTANNFLQLFFGWEGVGLVSYLLIGFWFNKDSANQGSMKAFIVNRVGDFGFILALGAILDNFNCLDYATFFNHLSQFSQASIVILPGVHWSLLTVICILLFIGAMGKSAQMPLHVWLPESMEGPTPISALIHAATMVTAGVFMVARMSPVFEYSQPALSFILVIGATGALFTGLIAIVQTDIKRVVAYSTLSQLGYMMVAAGCSAFSVSIFHLATHAFFKALLFLAAGSVIMGMHHEQDMRKMGGLWRYMPITYVCSLIGSLALTAVPPFAGFYSKDMIIEAAKLTEIPGAHYAYICVLLGAFITSLYTFRAFFMTFHGKERFDHHVKSHLHESPWPVTLPLIILAFFSIISGFYFIKPMLLDGGILLNHGVLVSPQFNIMPEISEFSASPLNLFLNCWHHLSFWLSIAGILCSALAYLVYPQLPEIFTKRLAWFHSILEAKYGFDRFNEVVFINGTQKISQFFYRVSDATLIDDWMVNGSGRLVNTMSKIARKFQTGYLYHYVWVMLVGLVFFIGWLIF